MLDSNNRPRLVVKDYYLFYLTVIRYHCLHFQQKPVLFKHDSFLRAVAVGDQDRFADRGGG